MTKQKIEWAAREKRRAVNAAVGRNFLKTITEPVTNSDSALKKQAAVSHAAGLVAELLRLKPGQRVATDDLKKAIPTAARRKILVQIHTSKAGGRLCRVVDSGPGMTFEELQEKFGTYAEAKAKGERTRSLFGRGALDVLLYHDDSAIYTVSNSHLSKCSIYWDKDAFCDTEQLGAVTPELLDRHSLPADIRTGGTVVEFHLKEGTPIPQEEQIVDRIASFYMMRLITADPNTELIIERIRPGGVYRDRAEHDFPRGVVIGRFSDTLTLPDAPGLPVDILVARADEALQSDPIHTDRRENGLLFVDDNDAVMDMTLLPEHDKNPFLSHIYGIVRITGIRDVLEAKLEAEEAVAVLTETRDGFNRKHEVTQALFKIVEKHAKPLYEKEEQRQRKGDSNRSGELNRRIQEALKALNQFNNEDADTPPPPPPRDEPIYFESHSVHLIAGVPKVVRAYVDPDKVKVGEIILFECDNPEIAISPDSQLLAVGKSKAHQRIDVKIMCEVKGQRGVVTVVTLGKDGKEYKDALKVTGVDDPPVFQPPKLMEFSAPRYFGHPSRQNRAILVVNLDAFTGMPEVSFWLEETEGNVTIGDKGELKYQIKVAADHKIDGMNVARVPINFRGTGWGQHAALCAKAKARDGSPVQVRCKLQFKRDEGPNKFKDFVYEPFDRNVMGDVSEDKVYVNARYKLHQRIFGKTQADFDKSLEMTPVAQLRAAQVIVEAVVHDKAYKKWLKGGAMGLHIEADDPITSVRTYIEENRMKLEPPVLQALAPAIDSPND